MVAKRNFFPLGQRGPERSLTDKAMEKFIERFPVSGDLAGAYTTKPRALGAGRMATDNGY